MWPDELTAAGVVAIGGGGLGYMASGWIGVIVVLIIFFVVDAGVARRHR